MKKLRKNCSNYHKFHSQSITVRCLYSAVSNTSCLKSTSHQNYCHAVPAKFWASKTSNVSWSYQEATVCAVSLGDCSTNVVGWQWRYVSSKHTYIPTRGNDVILPRQTTHQTTIPYQATINEYHRVPDPAWHMGPRKPRPPVANFLLVLCQGLVHQFRGRKLDKSIARRTTLAVLDDDYTIRHNRHACITTNPTQPRHISLWTEPSQCTASPRPHAITTVRANRTNNWQAI